MSGLFVTAIVFAVIASLATAAGGSPLGCWPGTGAVPTVSAR